MSILKIDTTLELINNFRGFTNTAVGEGTIVETLGYSTIGDGGGAQWKRTGKRHCEQLKTLQSTRRINAKDK